MQVAAPRLKLVKINVADAPKIVIDWAVAKCEGAEEETLDPITWGCTAYPSHCYNYSTDWALAGPIIEREGINISRSEATDKAYDSVRWIGYIGGVCAGYGPTPLIAAMRCYVASTLGEEIEVPEELLAA